VQFFDNKHVDIANVAVWQISRIIRDVSKYFNHVISPVTYLKISVTS